MNRHAALFNSRIFAERPRLGRVAREYSGRHPTLVHIIARFPHGSIRDHRIVGANQPYGL
jgi:hypothetical protein